MKYAIYTKSTDSPDKYVLHATGYQNRKAAEFAARPTDEILEYEDENKLPESFYKP